MKRTFLLLLLSASCFCTLNARAYNRIWQQLEPGKVPFKGEQQIFPSKFIPFAVDDSYLKDYLFSLNDDANSGQSIELPMPDGSFRTFIIWQSHLMAEGLAAKYPGIRTFTAYAADNQRVVAKLDYTHKGFHAMVLNGEDTWFIDPHSNVNDGFYICYYKKDFEKPLNQRMACELRDEEASSPAEHEALNMQDKNELPKANFKVLNGATRRTYMLALACTYEYAVFVDGPTPTLNGVLSAMVTSVNRVDGVYETELSVSFQLVANNDTLIHLTSADPYTNGNTNSMIGQNQTVVTARIGASNYDIGHVFGTNSGGLAGLGVICDNGQKARGVTGSAAPVGDPFDIDYVAHEMGHQFNGSHTFNTSLGSCSGNRSGSNAYEPGSGSTIMAYAGICGTDNLQNNSHAYFHARSLQTIYNEIASTNCATLTPTGNAPLGLPTLSASYSIPYLTPFELQAPAAIDSAVADTLRTYCWEEYDLSSGALTWAATTTTGPIFRSFPPTESRLRVFPTPFRLVNNVNSYLGEKLPADARTLEFKLTARSIYQGLGTTHFSDDSIVLNVVNTGSPFSVTAPNTAVTWTGGSTQTVSWNVSNTTNAPISCANVNIYLSVDGGYNYPYLVVANVPNSGTASVTVPNVPTTSQARIKVKGAGNVFFDISNVNFTINYDNNIPPAQPIGVQQVVAQQTEEVKIFPVPANDVLNISKESEEKMSLSVYNAIGQAVYSGSVYSEIKLDVKDWAKGVYYIHLSSESGKRISRAIAIQ
jgi:hypothetical protein